MWLELLTFEEAKFPEQSRKHEGVAEVQQEATEHQALMAQVGGVRTGVKVTHGNLWKKYDRKKVRTTSNYTEIITSWTAQNRITGIHLMFTFRCASGFCLVKLTGELTSSAQILFDANAKQFPRKHAQPSCKLERNTATSWLRAKSPVFSLELFVQVNTWRSCRKSLAVKPSFSSGLRGLY